MFQRSRVSQATFFEMLRRLVSWNNGNAAAELKIAPSSDAPPSKLTEEEMRLVKLRAATHNREPTLSASPSSSPSSSSPYAPGSFSSTAAASSRIGGVRSENGHSNSNAHKGSHRRHMWRNKDAQPGPFFSATPPPDYKSIHVDNADYDVDVILPSVEKAILARRSTKVFDTTRPVDKELIQRLLATTVRAPTGNNLQSWNAIVVHEEKQKEALSRAALGQRQVLSAPYTIVFAGDTEGERYAPQVLEQGLENGSFGPQYGPFFLRSVYYQLHGGPCQGMALVKNVLSSWYSHQTNTPLLSVPVSKYGYAWKQTMIPATMFLNLATAAGLDSCIMEGIDEEAVKAVVGLPARFTVPVLIAVGHAAPGDGFGGPRRPKSPRFAVNHLVRWGTY